MGVRTTNTRVIVTSPCSLRNIRPICRVIYILTRRHGRVNLFNYRLNYFTFCKRSLFLRIRFRFSRGVDPSLFLTLKLMATLCYFGPNLWSVYIGEFTCRVIYVRQGRRYCFFSHQVFARRGSESSVFQAFSRNYRYPYFFHICVIISGARYRVSKGRFLVYHFFLVRCL